MIKVRMKKEVNNSKPETFVLIFDNAENYGNWARNYHYSRVIEINVETIKSTIKEYE